MGFAATLFSSVARLGEGGWWEEQVHFFCSGAGSEPLLFIAGTGELKMFAIGGLLLGLDPSPNASSFLVSCHLSSGPRDATYIYIYTYIMCVYIYLCMHI